MVDAGVRSPYLSSSHEARSTSNMQRNVMRCSHSRIVESEFVVLMFIRGVLSYTDLKFSVYVTGSSLRDLAIGKDL